MRANARVGWLLRGSIDAAAPRHVYADSPLNCGIEGQRPAAPPPGHWKNLHPINWGLLWAYSLAMLAVQRSLPYPLPREKARGLATFWPF